ncbi:helix-turn-helix transcriptional regulator [Streptomyces sp. NPDC057253]|uniref:helix-turn-helix transcriptional regulator n=1 Tax=Streptomyces sp. NPDC057253 TaxID=3346069 RepID=UPI0036300C15
MTDYDERSRELVDRKKDQVDLDVRAVALSEEEDGPVDHPYEHVDSESLASHNLKVIRMQLGVSQQQIADRLPTVHGGVVRLAQTQIAKIERGERPWRVNEMFAIAEALGVNWTELFRGGPRDPEANDDHLVMLGARNKYHQAQQRAAAAKENWVQAEREELRAGMEMARTAARLGIEDPTVLRFLEFQGEALVFMEGEDQRVRDHLATFDFDARTKEIEERGRAAWEKLLEEARAEASQAPAEGEA